MARQNKSKKNKNWISSAVQNPGAFSAKAKKAGYSTRAYALVKRDSPGKLGRQARLALTLLKLQSKKK